MDNKVRISKLLSERGICSRREADRFLQGGQVLVNGELVYELGSKCHPSDLITLRPMAQIRQQEKVTIILNKPVGFVSCQPEKDYIEAKELVTEENQVMAKGGKRFDPSHLKKLSVCGRLDIDSKGLLVFTQDGVIAKKLIGENAGIEKEYLVFFEGTATKEALERLRFGLVLDDKPLKRAKVVLMKENLIAITLQEGRKRQIRRAFEMVGLKVTSLKRVRIGGVSLGDLPLGKWRFLEEHEVF
jgi:23S rRNA pseudouridine2604 synthase